MSVLEKAKDSRKARNCKKREQQLALVNAARALFRETPFTTYSNISIDQMEGLLGKLNNRDKHFLHLDSQILPLLTNFRDVSESESSCVDRMLFSVLTLSPPLVKQLMSKEKDRLEAIQRHEEGCE